MSLFDKAGEALSLAGSSLLVALDGYFWVQDCPSSPALTEEWMSTLPKLFGEVVTAHTKHHQNIQMMLVPHSRSELFDLLDFHWMVVARKKESKWDKIYFCPGGDVHKNYNLDSPQWLFQPFRAKRYSNQAEAAIDCLRMEMHDSQEVIIERHFCAHPDADYVEIESQLVKLNGSIVGTWGVRG